MPSTAPASTPSATSSTSSRAYRMPFPRPWSEQASPFVFGLRAITTSAESASSAGAAPQAIPDAAELQGIPREPLHGRLGGPCRLDVPPDLVDQLLLRDERALVSQPLPELEHEPLAIEIAVEVEQECLDAPLVTPVVRIDPDRDRGEVV